MVYIRTAKIVRKHISTIKGSDFHLFFFRFIFSFSASEIKFPFFFLLSATFVPLTT
ncbi:hypothetical protein HMPREF2534_00501 [Bacteroides thetaiotaomicron]|nr:hypothetical protein HMPREF2534_00501 [Bacteroides thetaiotaomicron]